MEDNGHTTGLMLKLVREHLFMFIIALCLLPLGAASIRSLYFISGSEITYDEYTVFAMCDLKGAPKGRDCVGRYEIIIGNTGDREETVVLSWPPALSDWSQDYRVLNIAADASRDHDPSFSCSTSESRFECHIERFAPGAMIDISLSCLPCGGKELQLINGTPAVLESNARIYKGDPRVNVLWRRVHGFLQIFM